MHFNSIKVRLKLYHEFRDCYDKGFQFHKGTIKTSRCCFKTYSIKLFQFHKGTIKTDFLGTAIAALSRFQFHKGTIKTSLNQQKCFANAISIP